MVFKINISTKDGKTYKLETEAENLVGKSLGDKVQGTDVSPELQGYEFEIRGTSDKAGFTSLASVEGVGLKKVLLTYGKAMHKRPKREGKKKVSQPKPKGLRMKKTVRGKTISPEIVQINLKTIKEGNKKLSEIFPDQNKSEAPAEEKPAEAQSQEQTPAEQPTQETPKEQPKKEPEKNE